LPALLVEKHISITVGFLRDRDSAAAALIRSLPVKLQRGAEAEG
jgi:hypothetical protein